jgi:hypothetical protein
MIQALPLEVLMKIRKVLEQTDPHEVEDFPMVYKDEML